MVEREINWTSKALKDRTTIMEYWLRRTGDIDYPVKLEQTFSATLSMLKNYPEAETIFSKKHSIHFIVIRDFKFIIPTQIQTLQFLQFGIPAKTPIT